MTGLRRRMENLEETSCRDLGVWDRYFRLMFRREFLLTRKGRRFLYLAELGSNPQSAENFA